MLFIMQEKKQKHITGNIGSERNSLRFRFYSSKQLEILLEKYPANSSSYTPELQLMCCLMTLMLRSQNQQSCEVGELVLSIFSLQQCRMSGKE